MAHTSYEIRPLSWNGIHCSVPTHWDVIVKGNSHLIIEQALQPLLEFRWQNKTQATAKDNHSDFIFSRLNRETNGQLRTIKPPQFLQALETRFELRAFSSDNTPPLSGAVITCRQCGTAILFLFFTSAADSLEPLFSFFESFSCCPEDKENMYWAIEDLSFKIPPRLTLDTYSFSFGLTKFAFKNRTTNLRFCRLTGASKQLSRYTFTGLFATFNGTASDECTIIDSETLILDISPSFGERLFKFLKRKKIYRWAKFHHFTDRDKILGIHMESLQPLDREELALIDKHYGFLQ